MSPHPQHATPEVYTNFQTDTPAVLKSYHDRPVQYNPPSLSVSPGSKRHNTQRGLWRNTWLAPQAFVKGSVRFGFSSVHWYVGPQRSTFRAFGRPHWWPPSGREVLQLQARALYILRHRVKNSNLSTCYIWVPLRRGGIKTLKMGLEPMELDRWSRFATKGSIGKRHAICVAESADGLML